MKISIIGGGIGGLTTAIALQKKGLDVTIYEAAPEIKEAGAGLWIAANAMLIFERLGLVEIMKQEGNQLISAGIGDHKGHLLSKIDFKKIIQNYGNGTLAMHRGKLQSLLLKQTQKGSVLVGKKLKSLYDTEGGVKLEFEDGTVVISDIVIGADGIKSAVRHCLLGDIPLRYSGQTCWRGIAPVRLKDTKNSLELWGTRAGLRASYSQVNENEVYWYITLKERSNMTYSTSEMKSYLMNLVAEFNSEIRDLVSQTPEKAILHNDLYDFKPISKWYKGNVVLIGDAAHATTPNLGQGACQAIEDAFALAECLAKYPQTERAFQKFQDIRLKKAQFVVNTSYQVGLLSNMGGAIGYRVRNFILKSTPPSFGEKQFEYLFKLPNIEDY